MPDLTINAFGFAIKIKIEGWQKIVAAMGKTPETITAALGETGDFMISKLKEYPAPSRKKYGEAFGYRILSFKNRGGGTTFVESPFLTPAQHLWWFKNIGKAGFPPGGYPYERKVEEGLAGAWKKDVTPVTVQIYNQTRYGHWVMGNEEQSAYHQGAWFTIQEMVDRYADHVAHIFKTWFDRIFG